MKYTETVGIDVSKDVFDVCIHTSGLHKQFKNNNKDIALFVKWVLKNTKKSIEEVLVAFEHTGLYSMPLAAYFHKKKYPYCMLSALEVKRSMGVTRGKNDKVDAARIAEHAYIRRDTLDQYSMPALEIFQLQKLLALRVQMVKDRAKYKGTLKEYKLFLKRKDNPVLFTAKENIIARLTTQINKLEIEIMAIINSEESMKDIFVLITSVKGIGMIVAANLIVTTNCFKAFDDSRKYACYAGIAPFEKQSGKSLHTRARVSQLANKKMKSLLNMAASSAILCDPELRLYYQRRVEAGKSKMSTLNIVRNKIVHRVFAVVKRGTPYVPLHLHAA